jgi:hypothetical protein
MANALLEKRALAVREHRPNAEPPTFDDSSFPRLVTSDTRRMAALVPHMEGGVLRGGALSLAGFCPSLPELALLFRTLGELGPDGPGELECVPRVWNVL